MNNILIFLLFVITLAQSYWITVLWWRSRNQAKHLFVLNEYVCTVCDRMGLDKGELDSVLLKEEEA